MSGDLLLQVIVKPHVVFQREGPLNVVSEVPVSLSEAILGSNLTVDTLDGKLNVHLKPGTNSGAQ